MRRSSYREQDYAFGQQMLTLRSAMGLTQASLAENLGISRRSVADWEAGGKYPKPVHLKALIALAIQRGAFPAGREAAEIRALWQAAHQKLLLDEHWLTSLLAAPSPVSLLPTMAMPMETRVDWGNALAVPMFYGREGELNLLHGWVIEKRCRVVSVLGLGGIGKSSLTIRFMHQTASQFEVVIWRSLRDLPNCDMLLASLLQILAPQALSDLTINLEDRLNLLLDHMRTTRVLLVLDNLESLLAQGDDAGYMRPGFEGFEWFLRQCAATEHQSCVLLTSREKPEALVRHEGSQSPVRALRLGQLDHYACELLLANRGVNGSSAERSRLITAYDGNPLALSIVAQTIVDLFAGEIAPFLEHGGVVFGSIRDLLHEQFKGLLPTDQTILFWLAIMREPLTLTRLHSLFITPLSPSTVLETVNRLHRRSLIERGQAAGTFTLQTVVLEYITDQLIAVLTGEIQRREFTVLVQHGLEQAQAKDYVREIQRRLLLTPLLAHLQTALGGGDVEVLLSSLLDELRARPTWSQGYAPANLTALLRTSRGNLRGINLSHLLLRGINLQGVDMQDAHLMHAVMQDCDFTETFDGIADFTVSGDGKYWAASSETGVVRLWEAGGHTLHRLWQSPSDIIYRIALGPDGSVFVGGTWDGIVKAWDIATGNLRWTASWAGKISVLYDVSFSPDGSLLVVKGDDAALRFLNARTGVQEEMLADFQGEVQYAWSAEGSLLATADGLGTIRLWTLRKGEPARCVQQFSAHSKPISRIAFSPDSRFLATVCPEEMVKLWDINTLQISTTFAGPTSAITNLCWSVDGRALACTGVDKTILLWDVEGNYFRAALHGHEARVGTVAFAPDGRQLISTARDGTLRIWDTAAYECIRVMRGYFAAVTAIAWSPDGQQVVSGGSDTLLTIFSTHSEATAPARARVLHGHVGFVHSVAWSSDGRWLASTEISSVGNVSTLRIWDAQTGECTQVLTYPDDEMNIFFGVAWSPDSQLLALGTRHYGLMICDLSTRLPRWSAQPFSTLVGSRLAWSPDGKLIATEGSDLVIYLWDEAGHLHQQLVGHHDNIGDVTWSPDSKLLVSVGTSELIVWDVLRGVKLVTITGHPAIPTATVWGTQAHIVITGGTDGKLRWWNIQTGECLRVRDAHQAPIQTLRQSPDGTTLASCGNDGAVMLWDAHHGDYQQTLRRDRPYERVDISGIRGLNDAQKVTLRTLGAVENSRT